MPFELVVVTLDQSREGAQLASTFGIDATNVVDVNGLTLDMQRNGQPAVADVHRQCNGDTGFHMDPIARHLRLDDVLRQTACVLATQVVSHRSVELKLGLVDSQGKHRGPAIARLLSLVLGGQGWHVVEHHVATNYRGAWCQCRALEHCFGACRQKIFLLEQLPRVRGLTPQDEAATYAREQVRLQEAARQAFEPRLLPKLRACGLVGFG